MEARDKILIPSKTRWQPWKKNGLITPKSHEKNNKIDREEGGKSDFPAQSCTRGEISQKELGEVPRKTYWADLTKVFFSFLISENEKTFFAKENDNPASFLPAS